MPERTRFRPCLSFIASQKLEGFIPVRQEIDLSNAAAFLDNLNISRFRGEDELAGVCVCVCVCVCVRVCNPVLVTN